MPGDKQHRRQDPNARRLILLLVLLAGVGVLCWRRLGPWFFPSAPASAPGLSGTNAGAPPDRDRIGVPAGGAARRTNASRTDPSALGAAGRGLGLGLALRQWRPGRDAAETQASLEALRRSLRGLPAGEAVAAIGAYLDARADAATQLEFKVGADGALAGAPTLRTFLLDELGRIDPAAAARAARGILSSMDSPDEWALALRNLAAGDPSAEGRQLAGRKFEQMVKNEAWRREPSVGFLEAFDVAVYLGGTSLVGVLSEMVRSRENQAVGHAAYLALDRLILAEPADTLGALLANPESMAGREVTRANYFARADVRDEAQRQVLEGYLLNPLLNGEELEKFAALYPSANYMVSNNLLTRSATPDHGWLVGRDREALEQVRRWLADTRFARRQAALRAIERRLQEFVRQTSVP